MHVLLDGRGTHVIHKRGIRVYREAGITVRRKAGKGGRAGCRDGR